MSAEAPLAVGLLTLVVAYLLGCIPFSVLLVRLVRGIDLRTRGSGNPGATNALRVGGRMVGLLSLVLDIGKGLAAVWIARRLQVAPAFIGGAAVAVVIGHVLSVFLRWRGGKGVAAAAGAMVALAPLPMLLSLATFALVVVTTRYVALASITAATLFAPWIYLCARWGWSEPAPLWLLLTAATIGLLIVVRHRSNLIRLAAGSEVKLGEAGPLRDEIPQDEMPADRLSFTHREETR